MVGEVFNLPLVSECVDWARYLIRRQFAKGRTGAPPQPPQSNLSPGRLLNALRRGAGLQGAAQRGPGIRATPSWRFGLP